MPDGGFFRGIVKRAYLRRIFRHCSGFLCIGSENRRYYSNRGIEKERLFSMPYTVDNDFFRKRALIAQKNRKAFRHELELEDGRPVILFAGKFQPRKNPLDLLAAFAGLDMERVRHPYLIFVGDGELKGEIEQKSAELGDRVRLPGFRNQTELPAFYDLADVFVLTSEKEPWGLGINEAMNAGAAIIASDECGCAADLIDPACGRIIKASDVAALRHALDGVLHDPEALQEMGQRAQKIISNWGLEESHQGLRQALISLQLLSA
jgi:glycosyltransferase involved in cell wall biosynthesis